MKPFLTLFIGLFFAVSQGAAQGGFGLSGTVRDAATEQPVPYASIAVYSLRDSSIAGGTLASEGGEFKVTGLARGRYRCSISFIGYGTWESAPFGFGPEAPPVKQLGTILLEPSIAALEEAEVVAEQSTMEMLIDRRVFHVGSDLTSAGANAAELLTRVPSVDVDLDGNVSLRGSSNVQILIDGRPSGLSGPAGQAFLAQIPSQSIDRVEIITNPSARFDPDGMAGILNIVMKKNKLAGFNGSVQATPGTSGNHAASFSLNYRNESWNVFSSFSANRRDLFSAGGLDRTQVLADSLQDVHQERDGTNFGESFGGRLGAEWSPSERTQWTVSSNMNLGTGDDLETLTNAITWGQASTLTERVASSLSSDWGWDVDAGFRQTYGGDPQHTLVAGIRVSRNESEQEQDIVERVVAEADLTYSDFNDLRSVFDRQVLSLDYTRPMPGDGRFEWGWKSTLSDQDSRFGYLESDSLVYAQGLFLPQGVDSVDYTFSYREDVHAAYGTYGRDWGAWGMQAGSRIEQVFTRAALSEDTPFRNDYFSWYPSANLSYEADGRTTWSASYSRRVNRPRGRQVNPYIDDSDAFNVRTGNPELRPEYTHSFEINRLWQKDRWSVSTALFHKRTQDVIRYYSTVDANGVRFATFANLASRHDEGLEVIVSAPLWKASSIRLTGEVYHLANDAGDLEAATNAQGWSHNWTVYGNLALGKHWKGQINGRIRGASVTPQGRFNGMRTLDCAVQRTFLDGKLSTSLRVSDVFDTREWSYYTELADPAFRQDVVRKRESRNVFLDVRWNFGKLEEGRRSREGGGRPEMDGGGGEF